MKIRSIPKKSIFFASEKCLNNEKKRNNEFNSILQMYLFQIKETENTNIYFYSNKEVLSRL